ncbi:ubiquitin elongating factor core-domain-containing protein [Pilobolus umbonatus]|nr:ubiquitin elongating factor core-domain-containing protein [Pilobolus umbonatus]
MNSDSSLSESDQIRLKRLAKLQQQQQQRQQEQESNADSSKRKSSPATSSVQGKKPILQTLDEFVPLKKPVQKKTSVQTVTTAPNPPSQTQNTQHQKSVTKPAKSFEEWQDDVLSRILQVTLNPENMYKQGKCIFLSGLVEELIEENDPHPTRMNCQYLDRIIVARLSLDPNETHEDLPDDIKQELHILHFDYLLNCWKQAHEIRRNTLLRSKNLDKAVVQERINALDSIKALLVSYSGLVLQIPDMFPQIVVNSINLGPGQLVPRLKALPDTPQGLPADYLIELANRFKDDGLDMILGPALCAIATQLCNVNILGEFQASIQAFTVVTEIKAIATMITTLPEFNPENVSAKLIESVSLFGPMLKLSAYPDSDPKMIESYFQNSENRNAADLNFCKHGLRGTLQNTQKTIFHIFNSIIRSSSDSKNDLLNYFAHIIRLNEKRAQIQVDIQTVSSDGFMHNIASILLMFCDPFLDIRASRIDKIDSSYFSTSKRLNVSEDTKIIATKEQSDAYYGQTHELKSHNFITECFFMTLSFLHYGPIRAIVNFNEFMREYNELKKQSDRAQQEALNNANTPQNAMGEFMAKRLKAKLDQMTTYKLAYETMIMDPTFLSEAIRFYDLVMAWMIRLVDAKHQHPWEPVKLPLPQEIPQVFAMLPEWIMEDIVELYSFVGKFCYDTHVMKQSPHDELVTFIITFLRNTSYVKNPYLKAKLVEILFFFTYPIGPGMPGELESLLNSHPLALEHLVPSLMRFYVEVEQTGASSQFYDKFNIRYNISHVMKTIWNHPAHRNKLREESRNTEVFTRFVNMLMSDVTYLMDESLSKLSEIHQTQLKMNDRAAWESQTPQERMEREGNLRSLERQAQSYVALGNETVHMLNYMTAEVIQPFLVEEIVDRLAAMLDYNLVQLVGPKCTDLRVANPEKYHFQPRKLLSEIIDIYLNLNSDTFVSAVAHDGRSYKKEYFSKAASILQKHGLKSADDIHALEKFINKVELAVQSGVEEEEELGEVPDEYLDPIFFTLMEDPVLLPTSGVIVDRSTIRAHLLGDTRDPFNRKALSMDMVESGKLVCMSIYSVINDI